MLFISSNTSLISLFLLFAIRAKPLKYIIHLHHIISIERRQCNGIKICYKTSYAESLAARKTGKMNLRKSMLCTARTSAIHLAAVVVVNLVQDVVFEKKIQIPAQCRFVKSQYPLLHVGKSKSAITLQYLAQHKDSCGSLANARISKNRFCPIR